jgi:predicted DNA-binding transcriptional regulator AlpA
MATDLKTTGLRGLDVAQMCAKFGGKDPLDPSTLWRRVKRDPDFPKPFYLWDGAPRWVEPEADAYIAKKIAERDNPVCAAAQRKRIERREARTGEARDRARTQKKGPRISRPSGKKPP